MFLICNAGPVRKDSGRRNPTHHKPTGRPCLDPFTTTLEGEPRQPRSLSGEGGMQKCWEAAAALGPQARWAPFPWGQRVSGKGGLDASFLHASRDGVKKAPGVRVKSAMPVRQATEMDLAARPVQMEPALGTGQIRGASRQAAHRGGTAGASLTRPLSPSRLFPLSGCRLYLQLHRKQRGRRRAEREKAQLVDEQRETCRKPSPQNTRNR